jgi:hypothetical protein
MIRSVFPLAAVLVVVAAGALIFADVTGLPPGPSYEEDLREQMSDTRQSRDYTEEDLIRNSEWPMPPSGRLG